MAPVLSVCGEPVLVAELVVVVVEVAAVEVDLAGPDEMDTAPAVFWLV